MLNYSLQYEYINPLTSQNIALVAQDIGFKTSATDLYEYDPLFIDSWFSI